MCYDSDLAGFLTAYQTMSRYEPACRCWALWTAGRRRRLRTQALIHERRQSAAVRLSETHTHTHTHTSLSSPLSVSCYRHRLENANNCRTEKGKGKGKGMVLHIAPLNDEQ